LRRRRRERPGPGPGARSGANRAGRGGLLGRNDLYVLIALVWVVHSSVADLGVLALPQRVEAVLQTIPGVPGGERRLAAAV
jgi:hypothetical protein